MKKAVNLCHTELKDSLIRVITRSKDVVEFQNGIPPYHYHDMYELVMLKRGSVEFIVNHSIRVVEAGSMYFFGNESPHGLLNCSEDAEVSIIHIPKAIFSWDMNRFPEVNKELQFLRDGRFCYIIKDEHAMNKLLELLDRVACLEGVMKLCAIYEIIYVLTYSPKKEVLEGEYKAGDFHKERDTSIEKAYRYIFSHFTEDLTLEQIALYANQNQTALCRSFKRMYGITIFELINKLRIEKACVLLRCSSMSISEIAYYIGYNCFSNFSIKFKAIIKVSPTQYRLERA